MSVGLANLIERVARERLAPLHIDGRVTALIGQGIEMEGITARVGSIIEIERPGVGPALAEVVGFRGPRRLAMPLTTAEGIAPGSRARPLPAQDHSVDARDCIGRVIDGLGRPLDGGRTPGRLPRTEASPRRSLLERSRIQVPLDVGIRAINSLFTIGRGARIGLFAGAGVGKSTLLGQIARHTSADVRVLALVGERGREVREFVDNELGDTLGQSIVVVATSDEPAVLRKRAAELAAGIAENLATEGLHVLLLMDSLTRFCAAQREIGLSAGEPPATRGYPPSVWSTMPRLLERAGTTAGAGSVTGIYTVLVEGDDLEEPVADAARSLLDGHIVLSRELAERGSFPAIDPLASLSRVMPDVVTSAHSELAQTARRVLATLAASEDLIRIGAYAPGTDPALDEAIRIEPALHGYLTQGRDEAAPFDGCVGGLRDALEGAS